MNLRFGETTRGRGLIFLHVYALDVDQPINLEATSVARGGRVVPANVMTVPGLDGWVVILAILSVSQRVTVTASAPDGSCLCSGQKTVAALAAKLHSQANTLLHNPVTEIMRNCDERLRPQGLEVRALECIPDSVSGDDVVYGDVAVTSRSHEEVAAPIVIETLRPDASQAALGEWTCMGDVCSCDDGVWRRVVSFSFRVPRELPTFVIWARSPQTSIADGVLPWEPQYLWGTRDYWRGYMLSADANPEYERWFLCKHRVSERDLGLQREEADSEGPLFSVVVPIYRTPLDFFDEMVGSVLAQSYGRFELILVNASPDDQGLSAAAERHAATDERIRLVTLDENLGISANTLRGVAAAQGDFVVFLDHDDTIEPDALYRYAHAVRNHPDTDLLYCDEDKLLDGHYLGPLFKPDWNVDLLCSVNYVCHLLAVRKTIVDQLPAEYTDCDGAQDHFLTLFAGERARRVFHVQRVLYHWRIHGQSTASGDAAKPYTTAAGVRAVQAHFDRCGIPATVSERPGKPNTYTVSYELAEQPLVSIVIPNKDLSGMLQKCIDSVLEKSTYRNFEIVVVENNSVEPKTFAYYEEISRNDRVRVVRQRQDGTFNFAKTMNFGVAAAKGSYFVFLNNDTEVIAEDWLERMLGICSRKDVGAVGAKLLYPNGTIQHAGVVVQHDGPIHLGKQQDRFNGEYFEFLQLTQDLSAVTAACMMTSREAFDLVGGFDESFPVDYNDIAFCLSLRDAGLLVVYEPLVELFHYESVSRGGNFSIPKRRQWERALGKMKSRWPDYFCVCDPYWNPNLDVNPYHRLNLWGQVIYND